ncbi:MAG: hypothetical protein E7376_01965 [Clostridiales bacterium]|nr:hypothetical protein [Clostridiales bacterium]
METLYLLSQNNIWIECNNQQQLLHKNNYVYLQNMALYEKIKLYENLALFSPVYLNLNLSLNQEGINIFNHKDKKFIEIITLNKNNVLQKILTPNSEIYIYNNFLTINYKTKFYSYYFFGNKNNYAVENYNNIYIFNKNNMIIFNIDYFSFNLLKCIEFKTEKDFFNILCPIQNNNNYYLYFNIDLINNKIETKKYCKGEISYNNYTLPFLFFYLTKNGFEISKNLITSDLNINDLKSYFLKFNCMREIEGEYYLFSNQELTQIKFTINNNLIIDID